MQAAAQVQQPSRTPCRTLAPARQQQQQQWRCRRQETTVAAAASAADPFFLASVDDMQQAMRQFDRDMDSMFWGGRSPFFEAERQMDRALRRVDEEMAEARRQAATTTRSENVRGNIVRERSESRAPGSYRYYERIEISSGPGWGQQPMATAAASAPPPPPLLLLAALVAAGAYAAVTAAFARNYDLTLYAARDKVRLALTWPLLLLTSRAFRAQFVQAVVRGERVRVTNGSSAPPMPPVPPDERG